MNVPLPLSLIVALMAAALPVTAQVRSETPTGPITRAAIREAVRLAGAGEPAPSRIDAVQQSGTPALSDWQRVRQLAPGSEIIVTVKDARPARRSFVTGDDSELIVSNGTGQVEHIGRQDVSEIRRVAIGHRPWAPLATFGGAIGGAWVGAPLAYFAYCGIEQCTGSLAGLAPALVGMIAGAVGGGMIAGRMSRYKTEEIIYRAP